MAVQKIDPRQTKAEVVDAFNALAKQHHALEGELNALRKQQKTSETRQAAEPPSAPVETPVEPAAPQRAGTMASVVDDLLGLRASFGGALSALSAELVGEATALDAAQRATRDESGRLTDLYGIDASEDALDRLVAEYTEKANAFEEEAATRRDAFEREMAELEAAWAREQAERTAAIAERDAQAKKGRQREAAEYKYALDAARNADRDAYERDKRRLERDLAELREARERAWAEREGALAAEERRFEELRAKVENFPRDLEAAIKRARDDGSATARAQAKVKADLLAKEAEGRRRAYDSRIEALESTIAAQAEQIAALAAQLDASLRQTQDLAVKAIEGAASTGSFHAIREIAMEQAKTQQKLK